MAYKLIGERSESELAVTLSFDWRIQVPNIGCTSGHQELNDGTYEIYININYREHFRA